MVDGKQSRRDPMIAGDPQLSRLYREDAPEEPPGLLDEAIRAAARREVDSRPQAMPARRRSWQIPLSVAAVLVLSVTLTLMMREQEQPAPKPVPREPAAADRAPPSAVPDASLRREPAKAAPADAPERRSGREREVRPSPAMEKTPVAPPRVREAASAGGVGAQQAPEAGQTSRFEELRGPAQTEGSAAPAGKPLSAMPTPKTGEAESSAGAGRALKRDDAQELMPEQWLHKIRDLRRAGRLAEAETSLAEFRKRYPGYGLPEDLREERLRGAGDRR